MNLEPRMDTNEHELILKDEVYAVIGCALEVLNGLGHGLLEKPYENALAVEFGLPEDRAVTCPDEFDLAASSWGVYLDELEAAGPGESLVWQGDAEPSDYVSAAIKEEVDYLNSVWTLPEPVADHWCDPDTYKVRYDFREWPLWRAEWRVTGPRKDYVMRSVYTREQV